MGVKMKRKVLFVFLLAVLVYYFFITKLERNYLEGFLNVSYKHFQAQQTVIELGFRFLLEKKKSIPLPHPATSYPI